MNFIKKSDQLQFNKLTAYEKPSIEIIEIETETMIANSNKATKIDDIYFDDEDSWWSKASTTKENVNNTFNA